MWGLKKYSRRNKMVLSADMLIAVVLDRSGSMGGRVADVIKHFNDYKEEVEGLNQRVYMSVHQFDDKYETITSNSWVQDVPNLSSEVYFARGSTALLDAVGRTIRAVDAIEYKPEKIVIVINTDGYENASREYSGSQIKEMVTERQINHNWQFVFIGAGIDAFTSGASYGFSNASTFSMPNTSDGYGDAYNVLAASTTNYSRGATTMDMSLPSTIEETEKKKAKKVKNESS